MVEGSVGVLWRTDGHVWEVQVVDGMGCNRGGDGILLPLHIRLNNQDSCPDEPKTDNTEPENLCWFCLKRNQLKVEKYPAHSPLQRIYVSGHELLMIQGTPSKFSSSGSTEISALT